MIEPTFGVPKTGKSRTIDLGDETLRLLQDHKREQAVLKLKTRTSYCDLNLIVAREWADWTRPMLRSVCLHEARRDQTVPHYGLGL
jgi:hypothetical protein